MACEAIKPDGTNCKKPSRFIVNGRLRVVTSLVCGQHLAGMVERLAVYDSDSAPRRHPDSKAAGAVFVRRGV